MLTISQENNPATMSNNNDNIIDTVIDKTKEGFDNARGFIHEHTKSEEQREAEKPIGQKINEATPNSAEEAGSAIGEKLDQGANKITEMVNHAKEQAPEPSHEKDGLDKFSDKVTDKAKEGFHNVRDFVNEHTKSPEQREADKPIGQKIDEGAQDMKKWIDEKITTDESSPLQPSQ